MAGVLKKESWPNPRERQVMRKNGRNMRKKICRGGYKDVENVKRNLHAR